NNIQCYFLFFFSSRRRHTRLQGDWSSDVCSSDLYQSTELLLWARFTRPGIEDYHMAKKSKQAKKSKPKKAKIDPVPKGFRTVTRSEERRVGKECRYRWST